MKKYLSSIGKVLLYLLIYFVTQLIGGIAIGIYCGVAYGTTVSQAKLMEIIQSKVFYGATIGGGLSLIIYIAIYAGKEENLWKRCQFRKISLKTSWYTLLAAVGTAMMTCSFVYLMQSYFKSYEAVSKSLATGVTSILGVICVVILMPIFEEILFRGLIFNELRRNINVIVCIIIQALIFAVAHGNILQGIYTFILGSILALTYMWTKSICTNILLHVTYNLMGCIVVPILLYYTQKFVVVYIVSGLALLIFALMKLHKSRSSEELEDVIFESV